MKLALEALESKYIVNCGAWRVQQDQAITVIREALASEAIEQPAQQEPVAWIDEYGNAFPLAAKQYSVVGKHWKPLYTSPPAQRKPLMDEKIDAIWDAVITPSNHIREFVRAIEAAHGIKENT